MNEINKNLPKFLRSVTAYLFWVLKRNTVAHCERRKCSFSAVPDNVYICESVFCKVNWTFDVR